MICDKQQIVVHSKNPDITRVDLATGTSKLAIITVSACCDFFGLRYYFFKLVYRGGLEVSVSRRVGGPAIRLLELNYIMYRCCL